MSAFSQFQELEPSRIQPRLSESFGTQNYLAEDQLADQVEDLRPSTLSVKPAQMQEHPEDEELFN
jgi:hypothetical protein